jgi:hypothetical protein
MGDQAVAPDPGGPVVAVVRWSVLARVVETADVETTHD